MSRWLGADQLEELICDAVRHLVDDGLWPDTSAQSGRDRAWRAVITAREVEQAPDGKLVVPDGALITPEARDRARERGVRLVGPSTTSHAAGLSDPQRALVGKLASLLAAELSAPQIQQLAYWCLNEGSCTDANGVARIVDAGADRVGLSACAPPLDDAIVPLIDHTLLKPEATEEQVRQLCAEALEYGFATVCINPYYVSLVADLLKGSRGKGLYGSRFPAGRRQPGSKGTRGQPGGGPGRTRDRHGDQHRGAQVWAGRLGTERYRASRSRRASGRPREGHSGIGAIVGRRDRPRLPTCSCGRRRLRQDLDWLRAGRSDGGRRCVDASHGRPRHGGKGVRRHQHAGRCGCHDSGGSYAHRCQRRGPNRGWRVDRRRAPTA